MKENSTVIKRNEELKLKENEVDICSPATFPQALLTLISRLGVTGIIC